MLTIKVYGNFNNNIDRNKQFFDNNIDRKKQFNYKHWVYLLFNFESYFAYIIANVIGPSSLEGERIGALILELGTLFSMVIILLGFKKKANYKK